MKGRHFTWGKRLEMLLVRGIVWGLSAVAKRTSPATSFWLADRLGLLIYQVIPRFHRTALNNLHMAFGDRKPPAELERIARRALQNNCRAVMEFLRLRCLSPEDLQRLVELWGSEHLDAALAQGRGVMLVTAHYGNWELMGARIATAGYPLTVITRDQDDEALTRLVNDSRESAGLRVIRRQEVRKALACLRRNEILGILADQNTAVGGVFVDFFGRPAATATGPVLFALRLGTPLLPCFIRRLEDNRHRVVIYPPLELVRTGDATRDIALNTARLTKVIEHQIAERPEEWLWIHRRWKRRPEGEV
ncbi:MAG TPA: lipid A biosynthesis acyltransferase [Armatimonadetes bacterium]|nr:lipid A biosynthesis acyltransferase [Armatimonadota bacterium]